MCIRDRALTIGTIESICASIFPDLMEAFHKAHPKVKVSMVLDSPDVLLDRMNHNAIDFVYLLDQKIYDHRWVKVLEEPEDIVFVASSAYPLAGRKALELKELLPEPFLLTEKDASYRFVLDRLSLIHIFFPMGEITAAVPQRPASANSFTSSKGTSLSSAFKPR